MIKLYAGTRMFPGQGTLSDVIVTVASGPTDVHMLKHIVRHSPTGFNWGYGGSGPADLALSILTDVFGGRFELADVFYFQFKIDFVAGWGNKWTITTEEIDSWLREKASGCGIEDLIRKYDAMDEEQRLALRFSRTWGRNLLTESR
jgi:hypothetical protein